MTWPPSSRDQDALASRTPRPRGNALVVAIVVLIGLVLVAGVSAYASSIAVVRGPFSLVDPAGRPVTDRDFRGRFMLIYFGYTKCPNHCPTMLAMTAAALKALGHSARRVQPIFITVDPEHDTPAITGRFTRRFSRRIPGLTGSPAQIESVEKAYGVRTLFRRTGPEAGAYLIDHPSVFFLVGPDGRFIAELQSESGPDDLAARIRLHL